MTPTTPTPLAALASRLRGAFIRPTPPPAPLPPLIHYILRHEFGGAEHRFACTPQNVGLALEFIRDHGMTDTCRAAFADAALEGRFPARHGDFWTLDTLRAEGE